MTLPDPLTAANQRASARDAERIVELERRLADAEKQCLEWMRQYFAALEAARVAKEVSSDPPHHN